MVLSDRLLQGFTSRAAKLYGERCMSFNVHQLTHLTEAARNFGPLWAHSAFTFESGNGHLTRLVTAANGVAQQVLERVVMEQELQLFLSCSTVPHVIKQLCHEFLGYPKVQKAFHIAGACFFGVPKEVTYLSPVETASIVSVLRHVPKLHEHFRFTYQGTVFHSTEYTRSAKSDSSVFESKDSDCFLIKRILEITDASSPNHGEVILLCGRIVNEEIEIELPPHIVHCFHSLHRPVVALKVADIAKPCVLLSFSEEENFVCKVPNLYERD